MNLNLNPNHHVPIDHSCLGKPPRVVQLHGKMPSLVFFPSYDIFSSFFTLSCQSCSPTLSRSVAAHTPSSITEIIREFVFKRQIRFLRHPFGEGSGNIRTSSIARWKARIDFIFAIIELFSPALTADTLIRRNRLS